MSSSENAKAVAREYIERVRAGKKLDKGEVHEKHGYSVKSGRSLKAETTRAFKQEIRPFVEKIIKERERALKEMTQKDLSEVEYEKLSRVVEEFTKIAQLLSGEPTENLVIHVDETIDKKFNVAPPKSTDNIE